MNNCTFQVTLFKNYITRSNLSHESVIRLFQVVCNASYNTIHNNRGKAIMEVTGFDSVRLPIYQTFTHNGFYNNFAYGLHCEQTTYGNCNWGTRATVVAGSAGQEYVDNVFYNRYLNVHTHHIDAYFRFARVGLRDSNYIRITMGGNP